MNSSDEPLMDNWSWEANEMKLNTLPFAWIYISALIIGLLFYYLMKTPKVYQKQADNDTMEMINRGLSEKDRQQMLRLYKLYMPDTLLGKDSQQLLKPLLGN
jgi:hypothetical protein